MKKKGNMMTNETLKTMMKMKMRKIGLKKRRNIDLEIIRNNLFLCRYRLKQSKRRTKYKLKKSNHKTLRMMDVNIHPLQIKNSMEIKPNG